MPQTSARPFLKWAGGKTQLLGKLLTLLPERIATYYEPFTGGGALFWSLADQGLIETAVLNDWNFELVTCYEVICHEHRALIEQLETYPIDKDFYLDLRSQDPLQLDTISRAARMIYLNKVGFNGLYRLNKKGGFNVPFGRHTRPPDVVRAENLELCSKVLNKYMSTILNGDFALAAANAQPGDAVYLDPPYVPLSATSNFKSYTSEGFDIEDQQRVATLVRDLSARGVFVMASNSDTPVTRDLYQGLEMHVVEARRSINSKGDKRGPVNELIVVGRPSSLGPQVWGTPPSAIL